jgi:phosphate transport system permease protein
MFVVGFLILMALIFVWQSIPIWQQAGLGLFTSEKWFFREHRFGGLSMIHGSVSVSLIALLVAGPIGIGSAVFAAEILPHRWRLPVKATVELLAGVPSVIYGLLGILLLRNWIYQLLEPFDPLSGDNLLTAGILLAVMILPTVMTLSDDALAGVPAAQRKAARVLGMTRAETILSVTLPQAWRGILAAVALAMGRALGEGIAVFMVIGRQDNQWPANLFSLRPFIEAGQTLTSKLVSAETNISYGDPLHWAAMLGLGLMLLLMSGGLTWIAVRLMRTPEVDASRP